MLPGAVMCMSYGQTGLIVGALWLMAFNGKAPAVAMLALKPHLGFLAIFNLRDRHSWLVAVATLAFACLLPTVIYGPAIWSHWFDRSQKMGALVASWNGWAYIGVSPLIQWGFAAWLASAIVASYLLAMRFNAHTAATAALIISPYSFIYDTPVASFGIALSLLEERSPVRGAILLAALISPSAILFGAAWVPLAMLGALWVQVSQERGKTAIGMISPKLRA